MNTIKEDIKMINDFIEAMGGKETPKAMKRIEKEITTLQFAYKCYGEDIQILKDKLHRRNLQIADLKKQVKDFGIGHLSMNDLTNNAVTLLKRSGYIVTKQ